MSYRSATVDILLENPNLDEISFSSVQEGVQNGDGFAVPYFVALFQNYNGRVPESTKEWKDWFMDYMESGENAFEAAVFRMVGELQEKYPKRLILKLHIQFPFADRVN